MSDKPMARERKQLLGDAQGVVLEIGIGTGANLDHYDFSRVKQLIGIEPAHELAPLLHKKIAESGHSNILMLPYSATDMPVENASVDTVVLTYTLCSIAEVPAALEEVKRVLKKGGSVLFCEHGRSAEPKVEKMQRFIEPMWRPIAGGCSLLKHPPTLFENAGLRLKDCREYYLPGPRPLRYNFAGIAVKA